MNEYKEMPGKPQETVGVYELLVLNGKHEKMIELLEARVSILESMMQAKSSEVYHGPG